MESRSFYRAAISYCFLLSFPASLAFGGAISQFNQPLGNRDPLLQLGQIAAERITASGGTMGAVGATPSSTMASFMVGKFATVPFELSANGSIQRVAYNVSEPNAALVYQNGNLIAPNGVKVTQGVSDPGQATGWFEQRASVTASSTPASSTVFTPGDAGAPIPATALGLSYQGNITQVEYDGFQYHYFAPDNSRMPSYMVNNPNAPHLTPTPSATVPEPSSMVLSVAALAAIAWAVRRRLLVA